MQSYFEMMETHGWNLEDSNKVVWTSDYRRSYDCTFCKQGFSNAQALGGHMNIHRRDRLKLKQLKEDEYDDDNLSSNTTNKNPYYTPSPTTSPSPLSEFGDEICYTKSSSIHRGEDGPTVDGTHRRDLQQLLLLDDAPLHNEDRRSVGYGLHQGSITQLSHGLDQTEVDLELRLGREPPPMSMALKEFL